jgi:hypothetical protein
MMSKSLRKANMPTNHPFGDEQQLADLAQRVYTLERRLCEGNLAGQPSNYSPHPKWAGRPATLESRPQFSTWRKIAKFLIERRLGPIDYIARNFDQHTLLDKPLYPNELLGTSAWERYEKSKETKRHDLTIALESQLSTFRRKAVVEFTFRQDEMAGKLLTDAEKAVHAGKNRVQARLYALSCDDLSPLFVHGVFVMLEASPEDCHLAAQAADDMEKRAALQYIRFRADYDATWEYLIPDGFGRRAEGIYRWLLGLGPRPESTPVPTPSRQGGVVA